MPARTNVCEVIPVKSTHYSRQIRLRGLLVGADVQHLLLSFLPKGWSKCVADGIRNPLALSRSSFGYPHLDLSPWVFTLLALRPPPPALPDTVGGSFVVFALASMEGILRGSASMAPLAKSDRFDRRPPKRLVCSAEKLSAWSRSCPCQFF